MSSQPPPAEAPPSLGQVEEAVSRAPTDRSRVQSDHKKRKNDELKKKLFLPPLY